MGQRLDRLVPALGQLRQGQRAGRSRRGRAQRQQLRQPRFAAGANRDRPPGRAGPGQLGRVLALLASGGRPPRPPPGPPPPPPFPPPCPPPARPRERPRPTAPP